MTTYNWQKPDWPTFQYDLSSMSHILFAIAEKMGYINGQITHLTEALKTETLIELMVEEAIKTSEIEGEYISRLDIRSSIKNKLGLNQPLVKMHDRRAQGIAQLILDARNTFDHPLTQEQLFNWHLMLLADSHNPNLRIASWRIDDEPMQIVSGHHGKWIVHYEAPPSKMVPKEMEQFLKWFNDTAPEKVHAIAFAPVRAAVAHLYFESIHPFEDGNGRIGRVIAEKALSQGFGYPVMLSLSHTIEEEKNAYYDALNTASKSNEITAWVHYFVNLILKAQLEVEAKINFVLTKANFFDKFEKDLNDRQLKVVRRMMQAGTKGFEGGMSAKKYMSIANTSKATATRDLQHLLSLHILKQIGSGRSIRYELQL